MAAIDICKGALGAGNVIACASTDVKLQRCKEAGADTLLNYSGGAAALKTLLKENGLYVVVVVSGVWCG